MRTPHERLACAKRVARDHYAFPGGYPMVLLTSCGGALCWRCVRKEWRNIVDATLDMYTASGWCADTWFVYYGPDEDDHPELCDHCGRDLGE